MKYWSKTGAPEMLAWRNLKHSLRVATAQGKQGNLKVNFSRQGKYREFAKNIFSRGIYHQHRENLRVEIKMLVLNIGPIRMYILMLDTKCRTNEGCTYVH